MSQQKGALLNTLLFRTPVKLHRWCKLSDRLTSGTRCSISFTLCLSFFFASWSLVCMTQLCNLREEFWRSLTLHHQSGKSMLGVEISPWLESAIISLQLSSLQENREPNAMMAIYNQRQHYWWELSRNWHCDIQYVCCS